MPIVGLLRILERNINDRRLYAGAALGYLGIGAKHIIESANMDKYRIYSNGERLYIDKHGEMFKEKTKYKRIMMEHHQIKQSLILSSNKDTLPWYCALITSGRLGFPIGKTSWIILFSWSLSSTNNCA